MSDTTLLFTDIEGSTRLLCELREGYAEALAEHRRLVRGRPALTGGNGGIRARGKKRGRSNV